MSTMEQQVPGRGGALRAFRYGLHWLAIGINAFGAVLIVNMLGLASFGVSILSFLTDDATVLIGVVFILSIPISLVALLATRPR